ncbi:MAG: amidohydrolase [Bacteroidales bacterium]|nr:amidohydrolase [Bacteroidales bacterium]
MKNLRSFILALFIPASLIFSACQQESVEPADLVILNAKILTIDKDNPEAEAIAIRGEWIVEVGSRKKIDKYIDEATEVIDAEGRMVFPGFNDAHAHFGPVDPDYIELRYITDPDEITRRVAEKVKTTEPGVLIYGGHWEHEMFVDKQWPTKELLDEVAPDNPVALRRTDGHSVLVNSYVLRASGITKDTPDPFGGEIQKDPDTGDPTGIFKESASGLLKYGAKRIELSEEEQKTKEMAGWKAAFDYAARLGVTSIQYPGGGNADFFKNWQEQGLLTSRIDVAGRLTASAEQLARYDAVRKGYPQDGNWIRFGYMKGFIDGTLGSGTLLLFEPLEDEPGKTGLPQMTYEELEKRVVACDAMGFQVGIHAIGTKANNWILNAYEKAAEVNGKRDARHRSEHAQILIDDDIPRFAELGVIASMQPTHCITDKRFAEKRIGLERCKGAYAWNRLLDAGAHLAFGTDYSVEPLEPMEGLYAAVSRKDRLGEEGEGWFPSQKLSMGKAIELYTLGASYAQFMEERKGMLKKDYLADLVIVNQDLLSISEEEIMKTKVDYTIVGGKIVFKRE